MKQCVGRIFKKKNDVLTQIENLQDTIDNIDIKCEFYTLKIEKLIKKALELKKNNDLKGALLKIKVKKHIENSRNKLRVTQNTLEIMKITLEDTCNTSAIVNTIKQSNEVTNTLMKEINIDVVNDVLDKCKENMEDINDISDALGDYNSEQFDEEALLKELDDMKQTDFTSSSSIDNDNTEVAVYVPPKSKKNKKKKALLEPLLI